jgi:hypothetical protein
MATVIGLGGTMRARRLGGVYNVILRSPFAPGRARRNDKNLGVGDREGRDPLET